MKSIISFSLMGALLCGTLAGCSRGSGDDEHTDKVFTVRRSKLIVGTLLRGMANAKETHKLFPEASYRNTLVWIQEQNTHVKKGDVVIRFETQELLDDIEQQELNLELKKKSLDIKKEEMRILLSENQSSLRVAQDNVTAAEEAYARYYKYDGKNEKDKLEDAIAAKQEDFSAAREGYQESVDAISNTIYDDEEERQKEMDKSDKLKSTMDDKERQYENAVYALKIFKKYTYPNTLSQKENKLIQSRLNLEKIKVSTASRVVQKENETNRIINELRKSEDELERVRSYLPMMEIKAPVDGILVYGDVGRRRDRDIEIELGMEVKRKRVMAVIPEMDNLIVKFELPEQFRHRVNEGAKAFITPDSMPTLKVSGKVSKIAVVPVNQIEWDRTSPKVYHAEITLDRQDEHFVSGMNVQVEVIEETLEEVVNIPVEAVFEEEGEYFVYQRIGGKTHKKVVELGKSNDRYVHIKKGLEVGDLVCLYSPYELDSVD